MNKSFRFGNVEDLDIIKTWDKGISESQLNWKLHNNEILLAEIDNEIVGYLRLEYLWSKYPYIGLIIVQTTYQRHGIGKI